MNYLTLPVMLLKFWFIESPVALFKFFASFNSAFFQLFSLPLLLQTYFKPLKNEYRQGLVGFSRAMGIVIKSFFIIVDILFFSLMLIVELTVLAIFLIFLIFTVFMLYG